MFTNGLCLERSDDGWTLSLSQHDPPCERR
jgi:hypothetical protein